MNCQKKCVKVVVPVYTETLSGRAEKSLRQTMKVLGRYPITLLVPEGLSCNESLQDWRLHVLAPSGWDVEELPDIIV